MQENTKKLIQKMLEDFRPVAEELAKGGKQPDEIAAVFNAHVKAKQMNYYADGKGPLLIRTMLNKVMANAAKGTSKAEIIFCDILDKEGIGYKYQYPIGPYRADFLFKENLVLELDGPQHDQVRDEKRDRYLKKMGYETLRVPLSVLFHSPQAVKEMILEKIK